MCGIAGFYDNKNTGDEALLRSMTVSLAHRGPDAEGFFYNGTIGLGHRRLSIIDLDIRSGQPFYSQNKRYIIIFNGEIYNYIELREQLKQNHSIAFNTTSDTEVLIECWNIYGVETLQKLNGMFAFAIYDTEKKEITIARDHSGIKPLYYTVQNEAMFFASELKALKKVNTLNFEIDTTAIAAYLHAGCVPAPLSIYRHIKKLLPGHYVTYGKNGLHTFQYYSLTKNIASHYLTDYKSSKQHLDSLLNTSVNIQMRSDVPFGIFLSGGVDSSLVTALAVKNSQHTINTFSIGFAESSHDESKFAQQVASHLKTNHHPFEVHYKNAMELASQITLIYDEPFADPSAIPTYMVSELARKHVSIALAGDGGDELFFGYGSHQWAARLSKPAMKYSRHAIAKTMNMMSSRYKRIARLLHEPALSNFHSHIFSQEQYYFSEKEISQFVKTTKSFELILDAKDLHFEKKFNRKLSSIEKQALLDFYLYLPDDLLTKTDRVSMKHSLEVRVPLLDHNIVDYAMNMPTDWKVKNGVAKFILKDILHDYLPSQYFNRPKQGFSIPLARWLKNDLHFLIDDNLNETIINKFGVLDSKYVTGLVKKFNDGNHDFLFQRLWNLIILQQWLRNN